MPSAAESAREIEVEGRRLRVTNLGKPMFPQAGFTKADVIDYYGRVAAAIVPHLRDRPLTLKRFPDGVDGGYFYEKNCPRHRPEWLSTHPIWVERYREHFDYCLANDLPSLVWLANLANLEMHCSLARVPEVDRPTAMVFDLDPGHPAGLMEAAELALVLHGLLVELGLESVAKSSGSKGIHVYVPLNTPVGYAETKGFARAVAETLARRFPERVVAAIAKSGRAGKVLVDWGQNDHHRTMVAPYSLRAKDDPAGLLARPAISTPVAWEEVEQAVAGKRPQALVAAPEEALKRLDARGDLFAPVVRLEQELPTVGSG